MIEVTFHLNNVKYWRNGFKILNSIKKEFIYQTKKYITDGDGIIQVNWTNTRLNRIRDEKLRKKAKDNKFLEIRIVEIKLKNGEIELLATNLTNEEFTKEYSKSSGTTVAPITVMKTSLTFIQSLKSWERTSMMNYHSIQNYSYNPRWVFY